MDTATESIDKILKETKRLALELFKADTEGREPIVL